MGGFSEAIPREDAEGASPTAFIERRSAGRKAALAVAEVMAVGRRRHGVRLQQRWLYVKQVAYVAHPVGRHDPTGDLVNARDGDCPAALHHLLRPGLLGDERVQQEHPLAVLVGEAGLHSGSRRV